MSLLRKYSNFIKLEHTVFSLPLIFAGAYLAKSAWPDSRTTALIIIAAMGARIVAMTLNRIIDREIDLRNPRTADRHIPSGAVKLWEAWLVVALGLVCYLLAARALNDTCFNLAWAPLLGFIAYPFFKRLTKWTHVGLGLVWSFVPVAGFIAVRPSTSGMWPAGLLSVFSVFWLAGFDIIYATQDEEFDRENNVKSLPAAWGSHKAVLLAGVFHGLAFVSLVVLYSIWFSGTFTVMLLGLIGVLLFIEQRLASNVNLAFFKINAAIGFAVFFFVLFGLKGF